MIIINFFQDSNYSFDEKKLKKSIEKTLNENNIKNATVDLAVVGEAKMEEINKKYYAKGTSSVYKKNNNTHPIFTFPKNVVSDFVYPKELENYLGEIVIYQKEIEARGEELAIHGTLHLLGIHH